MYQVIKEFYDLQDFFDTKGGRVYHHYKVGDKFPREGKAASAERVEELAGPYNAQGVPLIEEIYNGTALDPTKMTKDELIDFAAKNSIEVNPKAKKQDILNAVMTAPSE